MSPPYYFSTPKNGKRRVLVLPSTVLDLFRLQKAKQDRQRKDAGDLWTENNMIFSNQTGGYLSYRTVYDCFKRVMEKIGTPSTRFHDLRHTYTVLAIKSGMGVKELQDSLGHSTPEFSMAVYAHVTAHMRRDGANKMEALIQTFSDVGQ